MDDILGLQEVAGVHRTGPRYEWTILSLCLVCLQLLSSQAYSSGAILSCQPLGDESTDSVVFLGFEDTLTTQYTTSSVFPSDDWQVTTPEEQGMNGTILDEMIQQIAGEDYLIDSVVISRNGYLVLEHYPNPLYDADNLHSIYSVTKSITSALVGIAKDQGLIESIDQRVLDFFPERTIQNLDGRKENMTIKHLLTMTSGFQWDEWDVDYTHPDNDYYQLWYELDPIQFMLDLPMVAEPGDEWVYCSGASHLLSAIINKTSGMSTLEFAQEYLFSPIGINHFYWSYDNNGLHYGGHGLNLGPRDMARFGLLYLNNGSWNGQQIISPDWISASTNTSVFLSSDVGYAFQWWTYPEANIARAAGYRGQKIYVIPDYDLVVVFTASISNGPNPQDSWIFEYIFPSILQYTELPETTETTGTNGGTTLSEPNYLLAVASVGLAVPLALVLLILHRKRKS